MAPHLSRSLPNVWTATYAHRARKIKMKMPGPRSKNAASATSAAIAPATHTSYGIDLSMVPALRRGPFGLPIGSIIRLG